MRVILFSPAKFSLWLCAIFVCVNGILSANILAISFFSSKSHKITYLPLLEELGKRGHNVTIVSPFRPSKPSPNVTEILTLEWKEIEGMMSKDFTPFEPKKSMKSTNPFLMLEFFTQLCTKSYSLPQVQAIMKEKYDLVFLQPTFNECLLGLIHKLDAPLVLWTPMAIGGHVVEKLGGYFPPSFIPNVFIGIQGEMGFANRFLNYLASVGFEVLLRLYYEPHMTAIYRDNLKDDELPTVAEIMSEQTALVLSNGHFSLHGPKPFYPDVIDVGGIHSRPAKPLPNDLEEFIQKGKDHGFIYFSMGSFTGSTMPEKQRKMFLTVFSKLKQQVLWKWETESMPDMPPNVKLSKWLPQQDLLGHPKIKMFITHCGGGSTEEAIYHGTPLLGIPLFADQPMNAKLAKSHGFIVELNWNEITEEKLMSGIQEILNNPVYKNNVQRLSTIFKDQPDDPLGRAVYWMEYVIRHKGAPHLRNAGRRLNFLQYHSYDVIITFLVMLAAVLYVMTKTVKLILVKISSCLFRTKSKSSRSVKKSKNE